MKRISKALSMILVFALVIGMMIVPVAAADTDHS